MMLGLAPPRCCRARTTRLAASMARPPLLPRIRDMTGPEHGAPSAAASHAGHDWPRDWHSRDQGPRQPAGGARPHIPGGDAAVPARRRGPRAAADRDGEWRHAHEHAGEHRAGWRRPRDHAVQREGACRGGRAALGQQ
eukprot:281840-Chlamydomonas_euryale.AAC.2